MLDQGIKLQSDIKNQGQNEVIWPNNKPINELGEPINKHNDPIKEGNEPINKAKEATNEHNKPFNEPYEHIIELNVVTVTP